MFGNANQLSKFERSPLLRFMEREQLDEPANKRLASVLFGASGAGDDERTTQLPTGVGGVSRGSGGGGSAAIPGSSVSVNTATFGNWDGVFRGDSRVKGHGDGEKNQPKEQEEQIVSGNYGHNGGGKLYSYKAKGATINKVVTAPVSHWKSGKLYKTLFVIRDVKKSEDVGGESGINEARAEKGLDGINLKTIDASDMNQYTSITGADGSKRRVMVYSPKSQLPGWKRYAGKTSGVTSHSRISSAWRRDSNKRYRASVAARLSK